MIIDDPELRALWNVEGEEYVQILENGLLRLEAEPNDSALLEEVFRSAHSLKGASGMVGIESVMTLAHHFEDELGAVRRGLAVMTPMLADRLYTGVDAMRQLVREAGGLEATPVDIAAVLARLRGEPPPAAPKPATSAPEMPEAEVSETPRAENPPDAAVQESGDSGVSEEPALHVDQTEPAGELRQAENPTAFKIETLRVEPQKLDALMTLAGEVAVTTARLGRSRTVIDDLMTLWEEWGRDAAGWRATVGTPSGESSTGALQANRQTRLQTREATRLERMGALLRQLQRAHDEEITRLDLMADALDESVRTMRLLPFSTLFQLFPRMVRDLAKDLGKEIRLEMDGGTVAADKHLLEELKDPLMHLLRNAIDHGIELPDERLRQGKPRAATLRVGAMQTGTHVILEVHDDGRGLDVEAIRRSAHRKGLRTAEELTALSAEEAQMLIFTPGFSTSALITDLSGRGVGLDVVRTNIERLKGTITVASNPGQGCTFRLQAPITLATTHVLLVQVAQQEYALPVEVVLELFLLTPQEVFALEGRPSIRREDRPIPVARLSDLLELPNVPSRSPNRDGDARPCVLLSVGAERMALVVDALLDEQEVILKPFTGLLQRVRNVLGATVLGSGEICMVLNPYDLMKSAQQLRTEAEAVLPATPEERKRSVLLVDDSITTRTQEKRILESAGYEVVTAVDGLDAFTKLAGRPFDAVVSDIEMPNMDGLALAARIRQDTQYRELPIILVTSLATDADRQRGVEVGANAYITKSAFDQTLLLSTLRRLV